MKYTSTITIKKPMEEVVTLYENPAHYPNWMQGLQSYNHIDGTKGMPGAKSEFHFKQGKRDLKMVETIVKNNLPELKEVTYEAKNVFNKHKTQLETIDENSTKMTVENHFKFSGFMKLIAFFMPTAFRKQTMKYLNDFKNFVENYNLEVTNE